MMSIRRSILYFCSALALAFSGMGFAADASMRHEVVDALRFAVADVGSYGAEATKFQVEQAHMQSIQSDRTSSVSGLISLKNGFVQAFLMKSGVVGGKTGIGAGTPIVG